MKHPKSEDILKVAKNLQNMIPYAQKECNLNMVKTSVFVCGTSFCHAGWYAMATMSPLRLLFPFQIDFSNGVDRMVKDLGFYHEDQLRMWAHRNPTVWGNNRGDDMFGPGEAFRYNGEDAVTLSDIVDHWFRVYRRVRDIEQGNMYCDITKELATLPKDEVSDNIKIKEYDNVPIPI